MVDEEETLDELEHSEAVVNTILEFLIHSETVVKKIGEGATGVVLEADLRALPSKFREDFQIIFPQLFEDKQEGCSETEVALKVMKIYAKGKGQLEYEMQKKARQIISESHLAQKVGVPKAAYHDFLVQDEKVRNILAGWGVVSFDHAEVIIMDRIAGDDFEVLTYREMIRREPHKFEDKCPNGDLEAYITQADRKVLLDLLSSVFAQREGEEWDELLKEKLKDSGIISQEELATLQELLSVLHQEGFFHLDLHQGNLMRAKNGRLFLIDFDKSRQFDVSKMSGKSVKEIENEVYEILGPKQRKDGQLLKFFEKISKKISPYIVEAQRVLDSFKNKNISAWQEYQQSLTDGQDLDLASDNFIKAVGLPPNELGFDPVTIYKVALLLGAAGQGRKEEVIKLSQVIIAKGASSVVRAKLMALEEFLT